MSFEIWLSCLPLGFVFMAWLYSWIHKLFYMKLDELVKFNLSNIGPVPFWIKVKSVAMLLGSVLLMYIKSRLLPAFVFSLLFISWFYFISGYPFSILYWIILMFAVELLFICLAIYVKIFFSLLELSTKL